MVRAPFDRLRANGGGLRANGVLSVRAELVEALMEGLGAGPPTRLNMIQKWQFERGDGRYKHRWQRDEAGFQEQAGAYVGKCHSSIDVDVAAALLNAAG